MIYLLKIDDFIAGDIERLEGFDHFTRQVYFRLFKFIAGQIEGKINVVEEAGEER